MFDTISGHMNQEFLNSIYQKHQGTKAYPSTSEVCNLTTKLILILFPEQTRNRINSIQEIENQLLDIESELATQLEIMHDSLPEPSTVLCKKFIDSLPQIHADLVEDVQAILTGDPAAKDEYEVVRAYPGFYAIAFYRIANTMLRLGIPLIPRVITEFAHSKTGIDIHPGATIHPGLFIDHGTGIVIGETCVIGKHVKIYQGVTLGALSVSKEMANLKRHPTIEDNVVIYANATILGGETVIGANSTIGGNVWLTKSVDPESVIYHNPSVKVKETSNA